MHKNVRLILAIPLFQLTFFSGCQNHKSTEVSQQVVNTNEKVLEPKFDTLNLALDWRPNVLHSGIFYAQSKGWYKEAGLMLNWFTPEVDGYTVKPLKKVLSGQADISIGPSEHLFHYAVDSTGIVKAQAVATLLQEDMSAFVVKANSGIESPSELTGKTYLGYDTPLENEILKNMIQNDGGQPEFKVQHPGRLELWEAFLNGSGQVAWVFLHWEAALAKYKGLELNTFIPNDYEVPYGYSSVIMAPINLKEEEAKRLQTFLQVTQRGYKALIQGRDSATAQVCNFVDHPNFKDRAFIQLAQQTINSAYIGDSTSGWGQMTAQKWANYLTWMKANDLLEYQRIQHLGPADFYTNKYLQ